jgi:O-antigen/teichoic acid export membrane protein
MPIDLPVSGNSDADVQSPDPGANSWRQRVARWRRILKVVTSFFAGQGALQAANVLLALFLVHMLSIEAYAQFGLAFGFQSMASNLMDLGFASTIIPLVGDRIEDRALVGRYVRAASNLRNRAFFILAPFVAASFFAIAHRHHWSGSLQVLLAAAILLALYSSGTLSCYSPPFFVYRRLREFYLPQTVSAVFRLAGYGILQVIGGLNAWTAAALSALNVTFNGRVLAKKTRQWVDLNEENTRSAEREIIHYILPAMPAFIFAAFQSQITLFLISIFGQTVSIAQVAALTRIAQLFLVLQTFNMVIIEPYIARLKREQLGPIYVRLVLLASACCVPVVLIAFHYPQAVLWILGSKYKELDGVIGWLVLASCINYVAGFVWVMNRARKWVFWSGSILEIVLLLVVQIGFILYVGVRTTREAVMFAFASSFCYVAAHGYAAVYGFLKGPRVQRSF